MTLENLKSDLLARIGKMFITNRKYRFYDRDQPFNKKLSPYNVPGTPFVLCEVNSSGDELVLVVLIGATLYIMHLNPAADEWTIPFDRAI